MTNANFLGRVLGISSISGSFRSSECPLLSRAVPCRTSKSPTTLTPHRPRRCRIRFYGRRIDKLLPHGGRASARPPHRPREAALPSPSSPLREQTPPL